MAQQREPPHVSERQQRTLVMSVSDDFDASVKKFFVERGVDTKYVVSVLQECRTQTGGDAGLLSGVDWATTQLPPAAQRLLRQGITKVARRVSCARTVCV